MPLLFLWCSIWCGNCDVVAFGFFIVDTICAHFMSYWNFKRVIRWTQDRHGCMPGFYTHPECQLSETIWKQKHQSERSKLVHTDSLFKFIKLIVMFNVHSNDFKWIVTMLIKKNGAFGLLLIVQQQIATSNKLYIIIKLRFQLSRI